MQGVPTTLNHIPLSTFFFIVQRNPGAAKAWSIETIAGLQHVMDKVPMPHPRVLRSFVEQLHLEPIDEWTFRSTRGGLPSDGRGFVDAEKRLATYGGHVFAQAVWAASNAFLDPNFVVHVCLHSYASLF